MEVAGEVVVVAVRGGDVVRWESWLRVICWLTFSSFVDFGDLPII